MRVLKLRAVDFDYGVRFRKQNFGGGFDHSSLARAGWTQEQHRSDRPAGVLHPGEIYLIKTGYSPNCALLTDDQRAEPGLELLRPRALHIRIQSYTIVRLFSNFIHVYHSKLRKAGARLYEARSALGISANLPVLTNNLFPWLRRSFGMLENYLG